MGIRRNNDELEAKILSLSSPSQRQALIIPPFDVETVDEWKFQLFIVGKAKELEWDWYHTRDSRGSKKGFVDLVLWRERVIYAECKREDGRTTPEQEKVMAALQHAGQEVYLWRPSDWPRVMALLTLRKR